MFPMLGHGEHYLYVCPGRVGEGNVMDTNILWTVLVVLAIVALLMVILRGRL